MARGFLDEGDVRKSDLVDIAAEVRRESPSGAAWLIFDGAQETWVPKSLVEINPDKTITMPEWLAASKGLL
jgi:hypothetical protein